MNDENSPLSLCIFEDERFPNFFPLSLNRPIFDLYIGTNTLKGRLVDELNPESLTLLCRPYLAKVVDEQEQEAARGYSVRVNEVGEGEILFLNGRLLAFESELGDLIDGLDSGCVVHKKGSTVAARLEGGNASSFMEFLARQLSEERILRVIQEIKDCTSGSKNNPNGQEGVPDRIQLLDSWAQENGVTLKETGISLLSHYWQLIGENGRCIIEDFAKNPFRGTAPEAELFKGVDLINEEDIVIGAEVEVRSGTVLDASEGPIIIAGGVRIEPNAIINGPCAIGEGSIIRGGAKVGHGTSLGWQCRVGGEVEKTIIAPYSNKQHEGFLGHSYIGQWVNIGAGSCNSDLKNNYGHVRAWCAGRVRDTGRRFLGVIMGDHSKVAINTRFHTGTVVGFNANVLTVGFPPKFVPSFTWLLEPEHVEYDLGKAMQTAEIMMDRRNVRFTKETADLFKIINRFCRQSAHAI
jgi:UDP-N-acetylglucosamine diphosphorylase/glucosamine-1-phosphate N-acetyltransferase